MPDGIWVLEGEQPTGPLSDAQLREMIAAGRVTAESQCWYVGWDQWYAIGLCHPELFPVAAAPPPPPAAATPVRQGRGRRAVALLGCAAVLLIVGLAFSAWLLVPGNGDWTLLPSVVSSLLGNHLSATLDPAPLPPPETPALDVSPAPGLRLSAPAGHLDRARDFRAAAMPGQRLDHIVEVSASTVAAAVAGFEIDSGMAPNERFAAPVTLSFDLASLGVAHELWTFLQVARVAPDGSLQYHDARLEDGRLSAEITHNSPFVLMLVAVVGLKTLYAVDQLSKGTLSDTIGDDVDAHFRIEWPQRLGTRDTPEHRRLSESLRAKWEEIRAKPRLTEPGGQTRAALKEYLADPEVVKAYTTLHDVEWKKKFYYPHRIAHGVVALQRAGDYLWGHRRFRTRGERIEVYFLDPWPYDNKETFAFQKDGHFTYPYVHVNLSKVPDVEAPRSPADQVALDNLNVTLVHEIFHAVQKEYYNWTKYLNPGQMWGGGVNHWFMEATALVLEEEAKDYYLAKGWTTSFPLTADNLYMAQGASPGASRAKLLAYFKLPLDRSIGRSDEGHRGYAASQLLLFLRDRYYSMNRNRYLPQLLEAFGSFRAGPLDALVKVTSNSDQVLGADYLLFCSRHAGAILDEYDPRTPEVDLSRTSPLYNWPLEGPLSSPCRSVRLHGISAAEMDEAKLVIRTNRMQDEGIYLRQRIGGDEFRTITTASHVITMKGMRNLPSPQKRVELQRVESNARPLDLDSHGYRRETTLIALLPPTAPPKVSLDEDEELIKVEIPPSRLFEAGEVQEIRVRFQRPGGKKPLTFSLGRSTEGEIAWRQIFEDANEAGGLPGIAGVITPQELRDMAAVSAYLSRREGADPTLQLSYLEVVSEPLGGFEEGPGIEGPESEVFTVPISSSRLGPRFPVDGHWEGIVWVVRRPISLDLSQSGGGIEGRYRWDGEEGRLEGRWSEAEDAWVVTYYINEGKREYASPLELYLRRVPGEGLWLSLPPCVLHRPKPAEPETKGWFHWW